MEVRGVLHGERQGNGRSRCFNQLHGNQTNLQSTRTPAPWATNQKTHKKINCKTHNAPPNPTTRNRSPTQHRTHERPTPRRGRSAARPRTPQQPQESPQGEENPAPEQSCNRAKKTRPTNARARCRKKKPQPQSQPRTPSAPDTPSHRPLPRCTSDQTRHRTAAERRCKKAHRPLTQRNRAL